MMLHNLALGSAMISLTVVVHTFGLIGTTHAVTFVVTRLKMEADQGRVFAMIAVVLALFAVISAQVWLWAFCYMLMGALPDLETALYFSLVTFSTIGYGDVVPGESWRILAALEGVNGFMLIGWSTAYLIAAGIRVGPFREGVHF